MPPITAILPLILSRYTVYAHCTTSCSTASADSRPMNGMSHSRLTPVSSRSMKIRVITGLTMPNRAATALMSITSATAEPVPVSRCRAKASTLSRRPPGAKSLPGTGTSTTPVNDRSNSSASTFTKPRAGSLMQAYLPLKPSSTTK